MWRIKGGEIFLNIEKSSSTYRVWYVTHDGWYDYGERRKNERPGLIINVAWMAKHRKQKDDIKFRAPKIVDNEPLRRFRMSIPGDMNST